MNTPVSFEIAKLLKEKGFDAPTLDCYNLNGLLFSNGWCEYIADDCEFEGLIYTNKLKEKDVLAPTIAEVVMWFYEKHGIWIECLHRGDIGDFTFKYSKLKDNFRTEPHYINEEGFNSPTEAYETAILYVLNNLIT